jgi:hypothetical protein
MADFLENHDIFTDDFWEKAPTALIEGIVRSTDPGFEVHERAKRIYRARMFIAITEAAHQMQCRRKDRMQLEPAVRQACYSLLGNQVDEFYYEALQRHREFWGKLKSESRRQKQKAPPRQHKIGQQFMLFPLPFVEHLFEYEKPSLTPP